MLGRRDLLAIKALVGTEHRMSAYADKLQHSTTEWAHTRLPKHATASRPCRSYNQSWLFRGRNRGDPIMGGLTTYTTDNLSAESEPLKELTLGRSYPAKKWPRFSVIVELSANSKPEHLEYTVGVARRVSATLEFFAPVFFDEPFRGMNEWKKQIAPDCKNRKTGMP